MTRPDPNDVFRQLNLLDRNAVVHAAMVWGTLWLALADHWAWLLLYPAMLLAADVLYYGFSVPVFDPEVTIQRGYQLSGIFNDTLHSAGLDYGFNFYDGDYTKDRRQAQLDKFEYAFKELGLREGMRVIDIGCGCGDWLHWLQREKRCDVVGVNITFEQAMECRRRGLRCIWSNWKDLDVDGPHAELRAGFDAVTFWDTVEHYVPMKDRGDTAAQDRIYRDMFALASRLLDPASPTGGAVFISCLHMRRRVGDEPSWTRRLQKLYYCYLLDKFHSGCYPDGQTDQLVTNARPHFELVRRKDTTVDYYMTSKLEPTHFGIHRFSWTARRARFALYMLLTDPHWIQRILWYYSSNWMLQFDGDDIERSDMIHWWLTFRASPRGA